MNILFDEHRHINIKRDPIKILEVYVGTNKIYAHKTDYFYFKMKYPISIDRFNDDACDRHIYAAVFIICSQNYIEQVFFSSSFILTNKIE